MLPSDLYCLHRDFQKFGNRAAYALDNFPKLLGIFVNIFKKFLNSGQQLFTDFLHSYHQIVFQLVKALLGGVRHCIIGFFGGSRAVLHLGKNIIEIGAAVLKQRQRRGSRLHASEHIRQLLPARFGVIF